jgi:hypothetical protein
LEEHPEEDLVGLDSHKCLTEMEEDGDVEDTIGVEVEVLNAMVSEHPIEEVTRRRGVSLRSMNHANIGISSGFFSIRYGSPVVTRHRSISSRGGTHY